MCNDVSTKAPKSDDVFSHSGLFEFPDGCWYCIEVGLRMLKRTHSERLQLKIVFDCLEHRSRIMLHVVTSYRG